MAPVPHRGQRNEPAFVREVLLKLAEAYQLPPEEVDRITSQNVERIFDSISQL
jgi:TatD DNase family protein